MELAGLRHGAGDKDEEAPAAALPPGTAAATPWAGPSAAAWPGPWGPIGQDASPAPTTGPASSGPDAAVPSPRWPDQLAGHSRSGQAWQGPWAPGAPHPLHGEVVPQRATGTAGRQVQPSGQGRLRRAWQRLIGILVAAAAFIAKFGALILKLKYLGVVLTMFLSVIAYSLFFGWTFAIGFVLLILVHEMGHVIELRRQGTKASLPVFIPFLGAFVGMKQMPRSAYHEALSGLAGPYMGTMASVAVALWGRHTGSNFLLQLAAVGFLVNLFNLMPVLPLDGGRAAAALHPVLWLFGLVGLLAFGIFVQSPIVLIILVLGGVELWRRWKRRNSPASVAYHSLTAGQRMAAGSLYLLIVAVALAGYVLTYVPRSL